MRRNRILQHDLWSFIACVVTAYILVKTDAFSWVLGAAGSVTYLSSFLAGLLFTSVLTVPLAVVALGELMSVNSPWLVATIGAIGAVVGDVIIFRFFKTRVSRDLNQVFQPKRHPRLTAILRWRFMHWFSPLVGAFMISTPLPDELGLALLGLGHVSLRKLIPILLISHFVGILLLGTTMRLF